MKVAVTGASGHVGANLCRMLQEDGHDIRVLIHNHSRSIEGLKVQRIQGEINDRKVLNELFHDVDVVFHLAAKISIESSTNGRVERTNIDGTQTVIDACKEQKVKKLIYFSSIHALDHRPYDEPMDESRPLVLDSTMRYERSKANAQVLVLNAAINGFETVVLNPSSIIGPFDFGPSLAGSLLIKIYQRQLPALIPGGYNFVDVRDVCQAAINAIERGRSGENYLLAGHYIEIVDFPEIIENTMGVKTKRLKIPMWVARMGVPFITQWARYKKEAPIYTYESLEILEAVNFHISTEKAQKELGFNDRPIDDTVKDTLDWFNEKL